MPQAHQPADVVMPFIWLRELNNIEFPLSIATDTTEAAEIIGILLSLTDIMHDSIMAETVQAIDTMMNVLSPAECLLLERSQPIIDAKIITSTKRKHTE